MMKVQCYLLFLLCRMHGGESGAAGLSWRRQNGILASVFSSSSGPMVVRRDGSSVPSSRSISSLSTSPVVLPCSGTSGRSSSANNSTSSEKVGKRKAEGDFCTDRESCRRMEASSNFPHRGGNSTSIGTEETGSHHNESEQVMKSVLPSNHTKEEEEEVTKETAESPSSSSPVEEETQEEVSPPVVAEKTQEEVSTPVVEKTTQTTVPQPVSTTKHDTKHKKKRFFRKKKERFVRPDSSAALYSKKLKNRNAMNIRRKCTHLGFGFFFAALNESIPREKFVPGMTILTIGTLVMELLRYRRGFGWMNDCLHYVLGSSLRKHEMEGKFTGSYYYFLGVTCTAALFPTPASTLGICQLAIADPAASYFGRKTRHVYWSRIDKGFFGLGRNKGILGFLGGALACFPFNYRMLKVAHWGPEGIPGGNPYLIAASLGLGIAGAFADLAVPTPALTLPHKIYGIPVPPFHVDDNLVVPVVSGYACTQIFKMLGWDPDLSLSKYIFV